jgi:hypothetical protein
MSKRIVVALDGNALTTRKDFSYEEHPSQEILQLIYKHNINKVEKLLGNGNKEIGFNIMKSFLQPYYIKGYSSQTISKVLNKERHLLNNWAKRYNLIKFKHTGIKSAIINLCFNEEDHNINQAYYKICEDKTYKFYNVKATENFCYILGLILGDGNSDSRKIYISGGPYEFLDNIYPRIVELADYLGNRTISIKYYTKEDKKVDRNNTNASYWRIYIYWSALANFFNNKYILEKSLNNIITKPNLANSLIAGLFDADGYFTYSNKKPVRIGIGQVDKKWWFEIICKYLENQYNVSKSKRTRKYIIKRKNKEYKGISRSTIIELKQSSWPKFIDNVIINYSNKNKHLKRAQIFRTHAIKNKRWWHK